MARLVIAKRERATRRRNLARAIDATWSSLRSHLAYAVACPKRTENVEVNARYVREYAETIHTLAVELESLARKDFKRECDPLCLPL